jgi:hypothetical protein
VNGHATTPTPGVYREDVVPARPAELPTGVPAFLGYAAAGTPNEPVRLAFREQLAETFGPPLPPPGALAAAVEGFFANQGEECFVVRLEDGGDAEQALGKALDALAPFVEIDLVCVPDLFTALRPEDGAGRALRMQNAVLRHCDHHGDRFAILDAPPGAGLDGVLAQRSGLHGYNGALYHPWVKVAGRPGFLPPCGHVAGVFARSDRRIGVHKAPANEVLTGVVDLAARLSDADQGQLHPQGINALRVFSGRGIRVWGARTLSRQPAWEQVSVRRLFLTAARWIERNLADATFEPNDVRLWNRVTRELTVYFGWLLQAGALRGRTAAEAFYVKCDADTNPPEVRETGRLVTEIGLAPALPNEFVVVRIIHGDGGVEIAGPPRGA